MLNMSTAVVTNSRQLDTLTASPMPLLPWRDPQSVSPQQLSEYIQALEKACLDNPQSADLRTCLGMAYAMNYDVYHSMDALDAARTLEPDHFWAQLKYAELQYRLRALAVAGEETLKAVELARNPWELSVARKQLNEIRKLRRESVRDVAWTKPLMVPGLVVVLMMATAFAAMVWK